MSASNLKARVSQLKIRSKVPDVAIFGIQLPYGKLAGTAVLFQNRLKQ